MTLFARLNYNRNELAAAKITRFLQDDSAIFEITHFYRDSVGVCLVPTIHSLFVVRELFTFHLNAVFNKLSPRIKKFSEQKLSCNNLQMEILNNYRINAL